MSLPETAFTQQSHQAQLTHDVYDDGYLRVEHRNYYVACEGQSLKLPRTEFLILSRLARTPERIVIAADLWEYAWGKDKPLNAESLHVCIHRLRRKLAPHDLRIETMVNVGYRLAARNAPRPAQQNIPRSYLKSLSTPVFCLPVNEEFRRSLDGCNTKALD